MLKRPVLIPTGGRPPLTDSWKVGAVHIDRAQLTLVIQQLSPQHRLQLIQHQGFASPACFSSTLFDLTPTLSACHILILEKKKQWQWKYLADYLWSNRVGPLLLVINPVEAEWAVGAAMSLLQQNQDTIGMRMLHQTEQRQGAAQALLAIETANRSWDLSQLYRC